MSRTTKWLGLMAATLLLLGCTIHPLNIPDDEWQLMTPEQQLQARAKQAELDESARQRRLQQQAAEKAEQQRLIDIRQNAPYGDVVQCSFRETQAKFGKEWFATQPLSFAIHRSEDDRRISLSRQDRPSMTTDLHIAFDGLNVKVCRWYDRSCATLAGTERAFSKGYTQAIVVNELVQGQLYCSYPLNKERYPRY